MGVPTKVKAPFSINALPIRAYVMIWNEFFRDENVENAAVWSDGDEDITYTQTYNDGSGQEDETEKILQEAARTGALCLPVNKFHDYFTSCLPYPQRGPEVNLPMTETHLSDWAAQTEITTKISRSGGNGNRLIERSHRIRISNIWKFHRSTRGKKSMQYTGTERTTGDTGAGGWMYADLESVTAATINDLRKAVAVQQYYEALARGGSRYREQVQALWDVVISDKTVQIPEYLGGGRYHVNINQIVQTADSRPTQTHLSAKLVQCQ